MVRNSDHTVTDECRLLEVLKHHGVEGVLRLERGVVRMTAASLGGPHPYRCDGGLVLRKTMSGSPVAGERASEGFRMRRRR